ncbi:ABC transporter substrate-binding protein [Microvirga roseola]|uniref:ABC transporter substrate-binding protein n=1 Tax=Microvirga roseola TaxID=2883126 RepID=UPI001E3D6766|nr:ABC transporter substrate-binding protein [Microvirga roseola]
MSLTRRTILKSSAALAGTMGLPLYARAQSNPVEISVQYSLPVLFKDLMEQTARDFMAANPNIKVMLRAPEQGYEEILQRNLRDAVTNTLPDVAFHGLNRQRSLAERNIPVDLKPLMAADPRTSELGFSPSLLSLGQVGEAQTGIGFALSTPIFYYNADLVRAAGGNPDKLPTNWDDLIKLSAAIDDPSRTIAGMFYDWTITGNWAWQALVFSHGGSMLDASEARVAFADEPGQKAIRILRRMVEEGKMRDIKPATSFADFFAGRQGISMQSTAQLGRYNREIGDRFKLICGRYPIAAANGRIPTGGSVGMIFAKDEQKQKAAWEFIKFACGPQGATLMVKATGYMPATTVPATRDDMLKAFYRDNPNHLISIGQQDVMTGWYAFPGQNALKITDKINDHLQTVVSRSSNPDAALKAMAEEVQGMLPRRQG